MQVYLSFAWFFAKAFDRHDADYHRPANKYLLASFICGLKRVYVSYFHYYLNKPVGDRFARSYLYATSMFLCLNW